MSEAVEGVLARLELVAVEAGRRSAEIESLRSLPRDLVDALIDSGAFRLVVPATLGGPDADLAAVLRAVRDTSSRDGSTGWLLMSALMAGLDAARLPRHHAASVLGDERSIVAGHRGPGGAARATDDGGLVVTGRWSFGAGVATASWIGAGVTIVDDRDGHPTGPLEGDDVHCLFRRDQVVALDTWHAIGLRGTGSTDFQVTEAFVPEGRWVPEAGAGTEPSSGSAILAAWPGTDQQDLVAAGAAAVALGLAARAIAEVGTGRTEPDGSGDWPRDGGGALARTAVDVDAAAGLLDAIVSDGSDASPVGDRLLAASLHAVERSVAAIERCYRLGGPGAVLHASPLQRILRDVNVVSQHPAVAERRWEQLGQAGPDRRGHHS